jgi:hypothetical protein
VEYFLWSCYNRPSYHVEFPMSKNLPSKSKRPLTV